MSTGAEAARRGAAATVRAIAAPPTSTATEELFEEIESLVSENRTQRDPDLERRLLRLRHEAGARLTDEPPSDVRYAEPDFDLLPDGSPLPEVEPCELTPELLRAGILRSGCLLVRGLVDRSEAERLVKEIDRALVVRQGGDPSAPEGYYEAFEPGAPFDLAPERGWVSHAGGLWAADSPRLMYDVLEAFERGGLKRVIGGYLGEHPALSVNKCTLRKVTPDIRGGFEGSVWHQDGAFLGKVRALNVWLSLSHCGDQAPGLDIVPRRLDGVVPTGTEGAIFDWSASQAVAEEAAGDVPILRPIFEPGDVLLFDELFLHATAADPEMPNTRYAVESWFFGPSAFPADYVPLAF